MSDSQQTAPIQEAPRRRRRWLRVAGIVLLVVVGLVAAAPYLFRIAAVRETVLSAAFRDLKGTVHVGGAPLGWGSPLRLYDVEVRPLEGPPLVQIPAIEGDVSLWRLIFDRQALGTISVTKPLTQIIVTEKGPNFEELFPPRPKDPEEIKKQREQLAQMRVSLAIKVADATVKWQGAKSPHAWEVGPINVAVGLERPPNEPEAAPLFVVQPGKLVDHVELNAEMCQDIFQYVAPALAGVSRAEGTFSLELDKLRIPLDMPEQGQVGGRFTIHHVATSPSPLLSMLKSTMRLTARPADGADAPPPGDELWFELAHESVVEFEMHDGRVHHRDFKFGVGTLQVETSGSVGVVDESLDIVAKIHLPGSALENRPLLQALSQQTLVLPIQGTLKQPRIDAKKLGQSSLQALLGAVDEAFGDENADQAEVERELEESGLVGDGALFGEGGLVDENGNLDEQGLAPLIEEGVEASQQMLEWWKERREQREDEGEGGGLFQRLRKRRGGSSAATPAGLAPGEPPPEGLQPAEDPPGNEEATFEEEMQAEEESAEEEPPRERRRLFEGLRRKRRGEAPAEPEPEDQANRGRGLPAWHERCTARGQRTGLIA